MGNEDDEQVLLRSYAVSKVVVLLEGNDAGMIESAACPGNDEDFMFLCLSASA